MDEQKQEQQYIKGFNDGYLLAKHEPALSEQLSANPNEHNEYFNGLIGGKAEYEKEVREWSKSFSRNSPAKDDRDIDLER
jgi:hypothetical protein